MKQFPRHPLTFGPSPVHPLDRLSDHLGGARIWAKREDVNSGLAFGGNKTRKLEYIVPDVLASGADTLVSLTTFKDEAQALEIANDTMYGLGAGVWTRDGARAFRMGRAIKAGRVWTNCYHQYPAHAAFGGFKASGVGRENHKMMLDHYTQTKCLLVSYDPEPLGFF